MKRVVATVLLLVLCLSLCACGVTLDVMKAGGEKTGASGNFWNKGETASDTQQPAQQQTQEQQDQQNVQQPVQQQTPVQGNTYVPAVTKPQITYGDEFGLYDPEPDQPSYYSSNLDYWIAYCDVMYLNESNLYGMSAAECRIARNAIYAKSGRIFESSDLSSFFSQYSWYYPRVSAKNFKESMLNDAQKHNLNVVIKYEKTL